MNYLPLLALLEACGQQFAPLRFVVPNNTHSEDYENLTTSIKMLNESMGCEIVSVTKKDFDADFHNTFSFAYSKSQIDVLYGEGADGFYDNSTQCILMFPYDNDVSLLYAQEQTDGMSVVNNYEQRQILHEIGHAFGLGHSLESGSIMNVKTDTSPIIKSIDQYIISLRESGVTCQ